MIKGPRATHVYSTLILFWFGNLCSMVFSPQCLLSLIATFTPLPLVAPAPTLARRFQENRKGMLFGNGLEDQAWTLMEAKIIPVRDANQPVSDCVESHD